MIEMHPVALRRQKIKSDDAPILLGAIGRVLRDELRAYRQDIAPRFNPAFGITPVPLRRVRDLRQRIGIRGMSAKNFYHTLAPCSRLRANGLKFVSRS